MTVVVDAQTYTSTVVKLHRTKHTHSHTHRLPWWLSGKETTCNAGDPGSTPESGRYLGEGNDNPLQYSCLDNSMDRGVLSLWGHKESDMMERLIHTCAFSSMQFYHMCGFVFYHHSQIQNISIITRIPFRKLATFSKYSS